jgi:hypothetical protein
VWRLSHRPGRGLCLAGPESPFLPRKSLQFQLAPGTFPVWDVSKMAKAKNVPHVTYFLIGPFNHMLSTLYLLHTIMRGAHTTDREQLLTLAHPRYSMPFPSPLCFLSVRPRPHLLHAYNTSHQMSMLCDPGSLRAGGDFPINFPVPGVAPLVQGKRSI